jgi:hypothetical protein
MVSIYRTFVRDEDGNIGKKTEIKVRSWRVRDPFVAFLARYMALDLFERIWAARFPSVDHDDDDTDFQRWSPSYSSTLAYPSNRAINADANARLCSTFPVSTTNNPWSISYHEVHASLCANVTM